jgi:Arc/MetJ-type ribon-helix-helix transcriptional regulator
MPKVLKISIALTSTQIKRLRAAVKTGGYATVSEVIRETIRHWQSTQVTRKTKKITKKQRRKVSRKSRLRKKKKI